MHYIKISVISLVTCIQIISVKQYKEYLGKQYVLYTVIVYIICVRILLFSAST